MNERTPPQFAPKKAGVPGWVMILLFVIFLGATGALVARIMNNQGIKNQPPEVESVEVDPFNEITQDVAELKIEFREVSKLRRDETKFKEWAAAHKKLESKVKKFKESTTQDLKDQGIMVYIEDEEDPEWSEWEYKEGYSGYRKLMSELEQLQNDLIKDSPMDFGG